MLPSFSLTSEYLDPKTALIIPDSHLGPLLKLRTYT